jgi:hypothetical protein
MAEKKPGAVQFAALHERARALLDDGTLPREPPLRTVAGYGDGVACLLCCGPIEPGEVEYELEFARAAPRRVSLHLACHAIWDYERRTCEPG